MTVTRAANEQLCKYFLEFYTYDKDMQKDPREKDPGEYPTDFAREELT